MTLKKEYLMLQNEKLLNWNNTKSKQSLFPYKENNFFINVHFYKKC